MTCSIGRKFHPTELDEVVDGVQDALSFLGGIPSWFPFEDGLQDGIVGELRVGGSQFELLDGIEDGGDTFSLLGVLDAAEEVNRSVDDAAPLFQQGREFLPALLVGRGCLHMQHLAEGFFFQ